ncbi:DNA ligase D [Salipaludibacillus daqingensis]|uniref:DNA ligase D n=1 Tax=Salipaludibacillus daqingensis TaxID=3041001 RepID=UPI0024749FD6|nr:DNA ligase D [Salipaludibacillus daqingensis]
MKPMKMTAVDDFPKKSGWIYETKFDGFRCLLVWKTTTPDLLSMSGKKLNDTFPEIVEFCEMIYDDVHPFLPLTFDGELVYLENSYKSRFATVQRRSRMGQSVEKYAKLLPCHLAIFDLLHFKGDDLTGEPLTKRKSHLQTFCKKTELPLSINDKDERRLQAVDNTPFFDKLWKNIQVNHGEGAIAKRKSSHWKEGTRSTDWLKKKYWRIVTVIVTNYDPKNGYFAGSVFQNDRLVDVVHFRHGFQEEEEKTLIALFQKNGANIDGIWTLPPSICVDVACIDFDGKHIREPRFASFHIDGDPNDCTWKTMQRQLMPLPDNVEITSADKPIWPSKNIVKDNYLIYLQTLAPLLLPHLNKRLLTVIRFPHGAASGEHFYQKNCPDYAPSFVETEQVDDINYIICNQVETLLWLGNQLALEFHTPFQTIDTLDPTEIVFDLDPPSENEFSLAIEAALSMKEVLDQFNLSSFIKTSGRKGLQVYVPLPINRFSYKETRRFTSFVCQFLCEQKPEWFTTERLKKNRRNRLYLDYIQHDEGKTIIAPYSPRGTKDGLVATPLYWEEVTSSLSPHHFSLPAVIGRVKDKGDPFRTLRHVDNEEALKRVLQEL